LRRTNVVVIALATLLAATGADATWLPSEIRAPRNQERNLRPDPVPGNYLRPRHDGKRLTNSAQLMEPDTCGR
jgi:hypothetical protein